MELIVEDGSGVVGANSYVSLEESNDYFSIHPYYADNWTDMDSLRKQGLLINATRYLDLMFVWQGYPTYVEQELDWPRQQVYNLDKRVYLDMNTIPGEIRAAACEMAFHLSKGDTFAAKSSEGLDSLKIDVIELNFSESVTTRPVPAQVVLLLTGFGAYAYSGHNKKVLVG